MELGWVEGLTPVRFVRLRRARISPIEFEFKMAEYPYL